MPLVSAICTQCGSMIKVDDTHEANICCCCGTAIVTEKAIKKYIQNKTNSNNFTSAPIKANINNELEQLISAAKTFQQLGEYENAFNKYSQITREYPQDGRGWLGCIYTWYDGELIKNIPSQNSADWINREHVERWIKNASLLVDKDTMNIFFTDKKNYIERVKKYRKKYFSIQFIKNYIGNDILEYEHILFYVRDDKLYYQFRYEGAYIIFELTGINDDGFFTKKVIKSSSHNSFDDKITISSSKMMYNSYLNRDLELIWIDENSHSIITNLGRVSKTDHGKIIELNGCYIATAVYGSYDCPQVWTLRRFRDQTLSTTWYGRIFVQFYYLTSPTLVKWFGHTLWFRKLWKRKLDFIVERLNSSGVENSPYNR